MLKISQGTKDSNENMKIYLKSHANKRHVNCTFVEQVQHLQLIQFYNFFAGQRRLWIHELLLVGLWWWRWRWLEGEEDLSAILTY